jgi:Lar family restriction alleviation protein
MDKMDYREMMGCPFCGCRNQSSPRPFEQENGLVMMECGRCSATGPKGGTTAEAQDLWNVRHS